MNMRYDRAVRKAKRKMGRWILFMGGILVVGLFISRGKNKVSPTTLEEGKPIIDLSRYDLDTDGDRVPDFIEDIIGYNSEVSELERCYNSKCETINLQAIQTIPRSVMILLDSSGSMQQTVGNLTKMDAAKVAIREYLKKTSGLENTMVGLLIYGDKGTNANKDKEMSCKSVETVVKLGELKLESIEDDLKNVEPAGWTPIGLAIREAEKGFEEKVKSIKETPSPQVINEIVIISDGVETCATNPLEAAKNVYEGDHSIVVHVIGFAVGSKTDNQALREISQVGGGTYATAPTIDELKLAMDLQWDNYVRRAQEEACKTKGYDTYLACKSEALAKVNAYISQELSRDPRVIPYEEKLKIDRLRYTFPAYMAGTLDEKLKTSP